MFALLSYSAAAVAYTLLAVLLMFSSQSKGQGRWVLAAVGATAVWGLSVAATLWLGDGPVPAAAYTADAFRNLVWTLCLLRALPGPAWQNTRRPIAIGAGLFAGLAMFVPEWLGGATGAFLLLGSSVVGCLTTEQLYRNSTPEQKAALKLFLWTIVAIFGYDLFVFSDAALVSAIDPTLWAIRGLLAAAAVPFFVVSAKRHPEWTRSLFISRHVVFYSATLMGVGLYLIAMSVAGALIRERGGQWGGMMQLGFFVAALVALATVLSSARLRIAARVFITKHFYRNQYEYRDEWLRLIRTLSGSDGEMPIEQRGIKALADIVDSPGGQLWLQREIGGPYEPFAAWQAPFPSTEYPRDAPLPRFLVDYGWIIDSAEHNRDPARYNNAFAAGTSELPPDSIIVPLFRENELLGFTRLVRSDGHRALNYEDHDLLKTAGRQVATFLAHDLATEQLAETRQFEAYNKLSAFVMHDLKNLLSQQALLVENAKKYQHRPEFVADVVKTVDHGVQRMRRLLRQLERDAAGSREQRVELNALVQEAVVRCQKEGNVRPSFEGAQALWVHAQSDRLSSIVLHLIANAQEATRAGGAIAVKVGVADGRALIEIRDNGAGMTEEFIRRKLFKPFETTKGSSGMGIGVYQAREVARSLGGDVAVKSRVGEGTTVSIVLPLAEPSDERQRSGALA
jgi:putative PEP-CTERM system histidine kinase